MYPVYIEMCEQKLILVILNFCRSTGQLNSIRENAPSRRMDFKSWRVTATSDFGRATYLDFAGHVFSAVDQVSSHHDVEASDCGQRHCVVHHEPHHYHHAGIVGAQLLGVRVTRLEQGNVVLGELAHVREHGRRHGARDGQTPYGHGHRYGELGGSAAADGRVQLAHRVDDGEEPVGAQCGQREHGHADRYVFGRFGHLANGLTVRPRRHLQHTVNSDKSKRNNSSRERKNESTLHAR